MQRHAPPHAAASAKQLPTPASYSYNNVHAPVAPAGAHDGGRQHAQCAGYQQLQAPYTRGTAPTHDSSPHRTPREHQYPLYYGGKGVAAYGLQGQPGAAHFNGGHPPSRAPGPTIPGRPVHAGYDCRPADGIVRNGYAGGAGAPCSNNGYRTPGYAYGPARTGVTEVPRDGGGVYRREVVDLRGVSRSTSSATVRSEPSTVPASRGAYRHHHHHHHPRYQTFSAGCEPQRMKTDVLSDVSPSDSLSRCGSDERDREGSSCSFHSNNTNHGVLHGNGPAGRMAMHAPMPTHYHHHHHHYQRHQAPTMPHPATAVGNGAGSRLPAIIVGPGTAMDGRLGPQPPRVHAPSTAGTACGFQSLAKAPGRTPAAGPEEMRGDAGADADADADSLDTDSLDLTSECDAAPATTAAAVDAAAVAPAAPTPPTASAAPLPAAVLQADTGAKETPPNVEEEQLPPPPAESRGRARQRRRRASSSSLSLRSSSGADGTLDTDSLSASSDGSASPGTEPTGGCDADAAMVGEQGGDADRGIVLGCLVECVREVWTHGGVSFPPGWRGVVVSMTDPTRPSNGLCVVEQTTHMFINLPNAAWLVLISPPVNIPYAIGSVVYTLYPTAEVAGDARGQEVQPGEYFLVVARAADGTLTAIRWGGGGGESNNAATGSEGAHAFPGAHKLLPRVTFENWQVALCHMAFRAFKKGTKVCVKEGCEVVLKHTTAGGAECPDGDGRVVGTYLDWWRKDGKEQLLRELHKGDAHGGIGVGMAEARPTRPPPKYAVAVRFGARVVGMRLDQIEVAGSTPPPTTREHQVVRARQPPPLRQGTPPPERPAAVRLCGQGHAMAPVHAGGHWELGQSGFLYHSCDFCDAASFNGWLLRCRICNVDLCDAVCPGYRGTGKRRGPRPWTLPRHDQDDGVDLALIHPHFPFLRAAMLVMHQRRGYAQWLRGVERVLSHRWDIKRIPGGGVLGIAAVNEGGGAAAVGDGGGPVGTSAVVTKAPTAGALTPTADLKALLIPPRRVTLRGLSKQDLLAVNKGLGLPLRSTLKMQLKENLLLFVKGGLLPADIPEPAPTRKAPKGRNAKRGRDATPEDERRRLKKAKSR